MLVIKNLSLYLSKDLRVLLEDFHFSLQPDQKVAIIGEEGNGKSTLLKAIVDPESVDSYVDRKGTIEKRGEIIGYLPQLIDPSLLRTSTAAYLESKLSHLTESPLQGALYYRWLGALDLSEDLIAETRRIGDLSGGEKIKFMLFTELLLEPTMLLLDEPSNDLDFQAVQWLEEFLIGLTIPVMFVSHDEVLIERVANTIVHIEQLSRKSVPQYTIARSSYRDYLVNRDSLIIRKTKIAAKEQKEFEEKLARYQKVYERVQHELRSTRDPQGGRNLKDKMHTVKSVGRRLEKEKENLSKKPDVEGAIFVKFDPSISVPNGKKIVDLQLDTLQIAGHVLARNVDLRIYGPRKVCIVGANGVGKTTLLREIVRYLERQRIPFGYMPQDYVDLIAPGTSALDFLTKTQNKEEHTRMRTFLGSLQFTPEEMLHPVRELSGGQKAKLYFAKMMLDQAQVMVLDEPTRNLSPLSGPEIREGLNAYKGCIICVTHDRKLIEEVFDDVLVLKQDGLHDAYLDGYLD